MYQRTHPSLGAINWGSVIDNAGPIIQNAGPTIDAASKVVQDPALPAVACEVLRLNKITKGQRPEPCKQRTFTEAEKQRGIGLYAAITPIRVFAWARANPALAIAAGVGAVGLIGYIGYAIGKGNR